MIHDMALYAHTIPTKFAEGLLFVPLIDIVSGPLTTDPPEFPGNTCVSIIMFIIMSDGWLFSKYIPCDRMVFFYYLRLYS